MVTLRNANKKRPAGPYNLPAAEYCADGVDRCTTMAMQSIEHNNETGDRGVKSFTKRISPALRFQPGETISGLAETVLDCPEIAGAIQRGELVKL